MGVFKLYNSVDTPDKVVFAMITLVGSIVAVPIVLFLILAMSFGSIDLFEALNEITIIGISFWAGLINLFLLLVVSHLVKVEIKDK